VKLARDSTLILMHDDTLERTTDGSGRANELSGGELARLDAGSWFSAAYAGEPVPRFDVVAKYLIAHDTWANVEIKPSHGYDDVTGTAVALAARDLWEGVQQKPVLSSFSTAALRAARTAAPELPCGYLVDEVPQDWAATLRELGCVALHCNAKKLTPGIANTVTSAGYGLLVWTVNDTATARDLISWGVDALVTDRLDLISPSFA
jgi:glycerophosphoryl diester phosphodiesterase